MTAATANAATGWRRRASTVATSRTVTAVKAACGGAGLSGDDLGHADHQERPGEQAVRLPRMIA